jgi:hypothetical protein
MLDQIESTWLDEERPQPLPLDHSTTARVRQELLAYAAAGGAKSRRRRLALPRRAVRIAVSSVALAGAGCMALLATQTGNPHGGSGLGVLAVQSASAKQLNHLSAKLASASTTETGDATLVIRRQTYPNSPEIDGADLYADNGNYYYSPSLAGLPAVIKAGDTVNTGSADGEVRDIAAANAALSGPIDVARQQMSVAAYPPGTTPQTLTPTKAQVAANIAKAPAVLRQKLEQVQANDSAQDITPEMTQENGLIWDNSMDALQAGAGDPNVRAGVLKLLATIPQVVVTQGTLDGQPTLVLTAALLKSNSGVYDEQLIINANTGVPVEFIGGNQDQTPGVTIYYTITRVTVASTENGTYTGQ